MIAASVGDSVLDAPECLAAHAVFPDGCRVLVISARGWDEILFRSPHAFLRARDQLARCNLVVMVGPV